MPKTANVYSRIDPDDKAKAEEILARLGIPASNAISMFYKQIIIHNGLPFDLILPNESPVNISKLTKEELRKEIQKGLDDLAASRGTPIDVADVEMKKELGI